MSSSQLDEGRMSGGVLWKKVLNVDQSLTVQRNRYIGAVILSGVALTIFILTKEKWWAVADGIMLIMSAIALLSVIMKH